MDITYAQLYMKVSRQHLVTPSLPTTNMGFLVKIHPPQKKKKNKICHTYFYPCIVSCNNFENYIALYCENQRITKSWSYNPVDKYK